MAPRGCLPFLLGSLIVAARVHASGPPAAGTPATTSEAAIVFSLPGEGVPAAGQVEPRGAARLRYFLDARHLERVLDSPAAKMVFLKHSEYRRLLERKQEIEQRLARDLRRAPPVDAVLTRASYDVRVEGTRARVQARFSVSTSAGNGWKLVELVGGQLAVSRFVPPMRDAFLVVREMIGPTRAGEACGPKGVPAAADLKDATFYLLTDRSGSGELQLDFSVPVVDESPSRGLSFVLPRVPLSSVDVTLDRADARVKLDPQVVRPAIRTEAGQTRVTARAQGGETLRISWADPSARPGPSAPASAGPPAAPRVVIDRAMTLYTLAQDRIHVRSVLDVDVSVAPVPALRLDVGEGTLVTRLDEIGPEKVLDDRSREALVMHRSQAIDVPFRSAFLGQVRLLVEGEIRVDKSREIVVLAPPSIEGAERLREGFAALASQVPFGVEPAESSRSSPDAKEIVRTLLPPEFRQSPHPILRSFEYSGPAAHMAIKLVRPAQLPVLRGVVQNLEIVTSLVGQTRLLSHYKMVVVARGEDKLEFDFADPACKPQAIKVNGTFRDLLKLGTTERWRIPLEPTEDGKNIVEFDVVHGSETLGSIGSVSIGLARFSMPVQQVDWQVMEPRTHQVYCYQGPFRETQVARDLFVQRFVVSLWTWLASSTRHLAEPMVLGVLLIALLLVVLVWATATGTLEVTGSQGLALAGIGAAVILAVLLNNTLAVRLAPSESAAAPSLSRQDASADGAGRPGAEPDSKTGEVGDKRTEATAMVPVVVPSVAPPVTKSEAASAAEPAHEADERAKERAALFEEQAARSAGGEPVSLTLATSPQVTRLTRGLWMPPPEGLTPDTMAFKARFFERRYEWLPKSLAALAGFFLFTALFLGFRELITGWFLGLFGAATIAVLWALDAWCPFSSSMAAAGFGYPFMLLAAIRLAALASEMVEGWRVEGLRRATERARLAATCSRDDHAGHHHDPPVSRGSGDNTVSIKEIFTDPPADAAPPATDGAPAAPADGIDFVADEDDDDEPQAPAPPTAGPADKGGEAK